MLREKVEEDVCSLKAGKSQGVENIPSELLKKGGKAKTGVSPDSDMPEDLGDEGTAEGVDAIACHTLTKKKKKKAISSIVRTVVSSA